MPAWFWLNIPLGTLFFVAVAGVPLWMVLKGPDENRTQDRPANLGERALRQPDLAGPQENATGLTMHPSTDPAAEDGPVITGAQR